MTDKKPGLPAGWAVSTLADVLLPTHAINPKNSSDRDFQYIDIEALDNEHQRISTPKCLLCAEAPSRARNAVARGDVVFSLVRPYLKNIAIVPDELDGAVASTAFFVCRPAAGVDGRYLFHFLRRDSFIGSVTTYGNSPPAARDDEFARLPVTVAPTNEQSRIADALDELLSNLDAGVDALEQARTKLEKYRAAILKAGVEGSLTAEWREQHPDVELASELLKRMLVERRRRWEEDQLRKLKEKGQSPPRNWKAKYKEPVAPDTGDLPPLPQTWCWATLDQISDIAGGVTKGQKFRPSDKTRVVSYLRVANVQRGFLDLTEIKTIRALESDIKALRLKPGDVLFNEGGDRDKLGRGWIWDGQIDECIHQNHVFRARLISPEVQGKLVSWSGNSYGQRWFMREGRQSVNLASINMTVLRGFPLPLAPVDEQQEIVERVEDQLSVIDHLESDLTTKLQSADSLRQSILRDAYSGKLVPQDPEDEPASELLKRIATERAARASGASHGKRTTSPPIVSKRRRAVGHDELRED